MTRKQTIDEAVTRWMRSHGGLNNIRSLIPLMEAGNHTQLVLRFVKFVRNEFQFLVRKTA